MNNIANLATQILNRSDWVQFRKGKSLVIKFEEEIMFEGLTSAFVLSHPRIYVFFRSVRKIRILIPNQYVLHRRRYSAGNQTKIKARSIFRRTKETP